MMADKPQASDFYQEVSKVLAAAEADVTSGHTVQLVMLQVRADGKFEYTSVHMPPVTLIGYAKIIIEQQLRKILA
jgi:hypothetical protein